MKELRKEKEKLNTILENNKQLVIKTLFYTIGLSLLALVTIVLVSVNLFIAISHDLITVLTTIVVITSILMFFILSFFYAYLNVHIEELKGINTKKIVMYDLVKIVLVLVVFAIAASWFVGGFLKWN